MNTLIATIIGMGLLLGFIELLHVQKHDTYCKTEADWVRTLPPEIRDQL